MSQFRLPISLLAGLLLTAGMTLGACGDDDSGSTNCGPGTVPENGVCVPAPDTNVPTDTGADTAAPSDTGAPPSDTGAPPSDTGGVDTFDPTACVPEEIGQRGMGEGCTKDCQCGDAPGTSGPSPMACYSGPYLEGFSFCTLESWFDRPSATYENIKIIRGCFDPILPVPQKEVYMPKCSSLTDCQALSSQYTHCGTKGLYNDQSAGTACKKVTDGTSMATMGSGETCIISTLPPFSNYQP